MKPKVAIIRGAFLNKYEMQFYEPLVDSFDITAFSSLHPFHDTFAFPVKKLLSPMDLPEFPKKMGIINRIWTDAHYLYGLEKELKGFDLVHTAETYYHYTQQSLNAKQQGKVKKVVATVLENIPFNNEGISGRKEFKQRARSELDHMIALTERTKTAMVLEGADEHKISVISHFIDAKRFSPKQMNESQSLSSVSLLFCGRLERYKGVFEILYALRLLRNDSQIPEQITCVFVGNGTEKESMIQMENRLGIKDIVTHTVVSYDEMPSMYHKADIYVAPSKETATWQEQYNTTLLEAQASELPIVTTWSGGIPENVGDAAILVQPGDAYSLYIALKQCILDPSLRKKLGEKARQRALDVHDIHHGADKIKTVWTSVLEGQ